MSELGLRQRLFEYVLRSGGVSKIVVQPAGVDGLSMWRLAYWGFADAGLLVDQTAASGKEQTRDFSPL